MNGMAGGTSTVRSTDGGITWGATTAPPGTGSIFGVDGGANNFVITRGNAIHRTSNNGTNWSTIFTHSSTTTVFYGMDLTLSSTGCPVGWAVGSTGVIIKVTSTLLGINNNNTNGIPTEYQLAQNYPNPFNPSTKISYALPKSGLVTLKIYDIVGREVSTLVNEVKTAGSHIVEFNASNYASGTYFYRLQNNDFTETKKMLLVK